jgi:hypothetical protein
LDKLTFFSRLVEAIAWPVTFLVLVFMLRKEIPQLAGSIRKFKFKDVELEFDQATRAVAAEIQREVPTGYENGPEIRLKGELESEVRDRLRALASVAPRAAILEAWLLVESAAAEAVQKRGLVPSSLTSPLSGRSSLFRILKTAGLLRPRQLAVYEQLRALRNEATHAPEVEFSEDAVSSYVDSALAMAAYLEGIANDR